MSISKIAGVVTAGTLIAVASSANAANVTPDVIFGSGNANGSFTVNNLVGGNNIELGLRGKLRFNDSNSPENTFNYDGANTYTFQRGTPPTGFGFDPNSPTTPVWNFEWSVNTDVSGNSGLNLNELTYQLQLDRNPDPNVITGSSFDMIDVPLADHAIGDNTTGNGNGMVAADAMDYANLIANNNVAQNSWSYEFFNEASFGLGLENFDPNELGSYNISLFARDATGAIVAATSININVVPMPTPLGMAGLGLIGVAGMRRRR